VGKRGGGKKRDGGRGRAGWGRSMRYGLSGDGRPWPPVVVYFVCSSSMFIVDKWHSYRCWGRSMQPFRKYSA